MRPDVVSHILFRPLVRSDHGFVLDSFGRHMRSDLAGVGLSVPRDVNIHVEWLARETRGRDTRWSVATLASDPNSIVGWACAMGEELVFCYVRAAFRRWGIGSQLATSLVETIPLRLLYWTRDAAKIRSERGYPLEWAWQTFREIDNQRKELHESQGDRFFRHTA